MTGAAPQRSWRLVRASKDAMPASMRRLFMSRQRRRRDAARRRRRWTIVGAAATVVMVAVWLLWGTSMVAAERVEVVGAELLSEHEVREAAGLSERTPLLRVRPGDVEGRVAELVEVASVRVHRRWPDTVVVTVTEREAVAAVPTPDGYQLVDARGVVFQTVDQPPVALPTVVIATPEESGEATEAALTVLAALTDELRADLESLVVAGPVDIRLELYSGWTVRWGDDTDSEAKARVATALLDHEGERMDVSAPSVVSVR